MILDEPAIAAEAARLAGALIGRGCAEGAAIAVMAGNTAHHVAARVAAARAGLWFVPVNPRLAPPEVVRIAQRSGAQLFITESIYTNISIHVRAAGVEVVTFDELLGAGGPGDRSAEGLSPGDTIGATILFTSGTTGEPKACLRGEVEERARVDELLATYSIASSDVHLVACPLAHSAPGIFLRAARAAGARTALLPRFDAAGFLDAIAEVRATIFFLVPTQVERLLALPEGRRRRADWSSVRAFVVAGAPFAPHTKQRLLDWIGPGKLWEFYGSSETGTVTVLPPDEQPGHAGLVGRPPPRVELRLLDPDGREVAAGTIGEVFVRSPSVMQGYLGAPPVAGGFVSVGDLGRLEHGALTLVDRKHDTIISGGVNVYPAEVERALLEHPCIASAVVCGLPDAQWGEIVAAVIATRAPVDVAELGAFLRERIAGYELPRRFEVVPLDEMPVGPSGKPLRRAARARFART